jgi:hypothetical protein
MQQLVMPLDSHLETGALGSCHLVLELEVSRFLLSPEGLRPSSNGRRSSGGKLDEAIEREDAFHPGTLKCSRRLFRLLPSWW